MRKYLTKTLPILLVLLAFSCGDKEEVDIPVRGELVSQELTFSVSSALLKSFTQNPELNAAIKYGVEVFRVTYYTTYKDKIIEASGMIAVPQTTDPIATVSFQHGTIASNSEAPSMLPNFDPELVLASTLASMGFVTVVPDFIGFGASSEIVHPYYVADLTSEAILDNILASDDLAVVLGKNQTKDLYLAGYSQGGYATMVTHKAIEENGFADYELKASFPSSGGYDIKGVQDFFFEQETYDQPFFIAYVAYGYYTAYDWDSSLSTFFNEPYASRIPELFDGSMSGSQINAQLTENISELINPDYLNQEPNDPAYLEINAAYAANSPINWVPEVPIYMYHGDADVTVPYQNSVDVYNQFLEQGASAEIVSFTTIKGGTHGSAFGPYLESFVGTLIEMENED